MFHSFSSQEERNEREDEGKEGKAGLRLEFPATLSALPLCCWQVLWKMEMPLHGFHSMVKSNLKAGGIRGDLILLTPWLGLSIYLPSQWP